MNIELRDYFAGQALAGLLAKYGAWQIRCSHIDYDDILVEAYKYADAMMKARERK